MGTCLTCNSASSNTKKRNNIHKEITSTISTSNTSHTPIKDTNNNNNNNDVNHNEQPSTNNNNNTNNVNTPYLLPSSLKVNHDDITSKYVLTDSLGSGISGKVFIANKINSSKSFAIKQINKSSVQTPSQLIKEAEFNQSISHPNIIQCYEIFENETTISFVLELSEEGDLFDFISNSPNKKLPLDLAIDLSEQILSTIDYLHNAKGIMHRDIKPENFMINIDKKNNPHIKLIDFGLAEYIPTKKDVYLTEPVGTQMYIPPEMVDGDIYNEKTDIWSCGVMLYKMFTGCDLFLGRNTAEIEKEIKFKEICFEYVEDLAVRELMKRMLERDMKKRINAEDAYRMIRDVKRVRDEEMGKTCYKYQFKKKDADVGRREMNMFMNGFGGGMLMM